MRKPLISILCVVVLSVVALRLRADDTPKQSPAKPQEATIQFTSHSNLVMIPVIVHRSGKHFPGLRKEDFIVQEDGKPVDVKDFEEVNTVTATSAQKVAAGGAVKTEFSNVGPDAPTRFTMIVLDGTSTQWQNNAFARLGVLKFLRENIGGDQPIAIVKVGRYGHIRIIHDFSSDMQILAQSLDNQMKRTQAVVDAARNGKPVVAESQQPVIGSTGSLVQVDDVFADFNGSFSSLDAQDAVCANVAAIRSLARGFAGVPGRKSLIWVGDEAPLLPPLMEGSRCPLVSGEALLELNTANMAVYPVEARGLTVTLRGSPTMLPLSNHGARVVDPNQELAQMRTLTEDLQRSNSALALSQGNMQWVADATGGKAYKNSNDIAGSVLKAANDSAGYYQLSYYLKPDEKPGWHKLSVKVNVHGMEVRTRSGFLTRVEKPGADAQDLTRALGSPFMQSEIPLLVRWSGVGGSGDTRRVDFELSVPPRGLTIDDTDTNRMSLSIHAIATGVAKPVEVVNRELNGHLTDPSVQKFSRSGLNYTGAFEVPVGVYEIRFAVRDNVSGKVGTVIAALDAK